MVDSGPIHGFFLRYYRMGSFFSSSLIVPAFLDSCIDDKEALRPQLSCSSMHPGSDALSPVLVIVLVLNLFDYVADLFGRRSVWHFSHLLDDAVAEIPSDC